MKPHGRNPLVEAMRSAVVVVAVITIAKVGVQAQGTDPNEVADFCESDGASSMPPHPPSSLQESVQC